MEKKRLTIPAGILSETTRTPSRRDRATHALCRIGNCLFLDGLTPLGIFRSGSGGLPARRRGSSRDPE